MKTTKETMPLAAFARRVREEAEKLAEKYPDVQYVKVSPEGSPCDGSDCFYTSGKFQRGEEELLDNLDGKCGCIVGIALTNAYPRSKGFLREMDGWLCLPSAIRAVEKIHIKFFNKGGDGDRLAEELYREVPDLRWLDTLQNHQDRGYCWKEAADMATKLCQRTPNQ